MASGAPPGSGEGDAPRLDRDGNAILGSSDAVTVAATHGLERYVVQVDDGDVLADVVDEVSADGAIVTDTWDGAVVGFSAALDAASAESLRERDGVVAVEPDQQITLSGMQDDAPWNLDRIDQRNLPLNTKYSYRDTGAGVTVYVIDTGIRPTHVDFGGRITRGAYWDFGDGTQYLDCQGHGTHVSGTVGGATWGVAKSATIVPVKVFACSGSTATSIIIAGINWVVADHAVGQPAVVNMSLGGSPSAVFDAAVTALINDGITVVVSAGNDAAPSCNQSPARVPAAITVAASTSADDNASFSNYGACNDLFAPGVNITSASYQSDTGTAAKSGTSMAAPAVAGAAALILQRSPTATPAQVWAAMDGDTTKGMLSECCGDPDKLLHVTPLVAAPTAATGLRRTVAPAAAVRSGQVRLSWSAPGSTGGSPITDYAIQRSRNGTTWTTIGDGVSTARAFKVTRLANGTPYRFRVAARNALGLGPWSATVAATPRWKPTAPIRLTAATSPARGVGSRQVKLTWNAPRSNRGARITDYVIQRSVNGRKWTTVRDGVSTRRSVVVSRLANGTQYRFRLAAKNVVGAGPWSRIVRATPHAP